MRVGLEPVRREGSSEKPRVLALLDRLAVCLSLHLASHVFVVLVRAVDDGVGGLHVRTT